MIQVQLCKRFEIQDTKWEEFVSFNAEDIIYFHAWYLDLVCIDWQAIIVKENGKWLAIMPFQIKHKLGLHYSLQPKFCKYLGVIFSKNLKTKLNLNSIQKKILFQIINALPNSIYYFNAKFHSGLINFLPFYWSGFTVKPRISYRLSMNSAPNYSTNITNHIKKANLHNLKCYSQHCPEDILKLARDRKLLNADSLSILRKLWEHLDNKENCLLLTVFDNLNQIHCAAIFAQENSKVFMIYSVVNDKLKKQGANSLLLSNAIEYYRQKDADWFYFEGSMFKNVEAYLNGFNVEPVLYFNISKCLIPFSESIFIPAYKKINKFIFS